MRTYSLPVTTPKVSSEKAKMKSIEEAEARALAAYQNVKHYTTPLSQVDNIMVKALVSDADVVANPAKYHATSVGEPKHIATFDTEAKAAVGDITKAKTLTEYEYPTDNIIKIIERS